MAQKLRAVFENTSNYYCNDWNLLEDGRLVYAAPFAISEYEKVVVGESFENRGVFLGYGYYHVKGPE
jgi:hypothetical protein